MVKTSFVQTMRLFPRSILLALILGFLLPSSCVLWFMVKAIENEALATSQRNKELAQARSDSLKIRFHAWVKSNIETLNQYESKAINNILSASSIFYSITHNGEADAAIIALNETQNYPHKPAIQPPTLLNQDWLDAQSEEFLSKNYENALSIYRSIPDQTDLIDLHAQALYAAARVYRKMGKPNNALDLLIEDLQQTKFKQTKSDTGHLLHLTALLTALDISIYEKTDEKYHDISDTLVKKLLAAIDYDNNDIPSYQRLFIQKRLSRIEDTGFQNKIKRELFIANAYDLLKDEIKNHESDSFNFSHKKMSKNNNLFFGDTAIDDIYWLRSKSGKLLSIYTITTLNLIAKDIADQLGLSNDVKLIQKEYIPQDVENISDFDFIIPNHYIVILKDDGQLSTTNIPHRYTIVGIILIILIALIVSAVAAIIGANLKRNQLKNDLLTTVSHELKTPLASINLMVDTLSDDKNLTRFEVDEFLRLIKRENEKLTILVENFLSFTRFEKSDVEFYLYELSLNEIVNNALTYLEEKINREGFKINLHNTADNLFVKADANMLSIAIVNIVDNALNYSEDKKIIDVKIFKDHDDACISVKDQGVGLSQADQKRIFQKFYRAEHRLSQRRRGTGLGLNLCQTIIEKHHGRISVESEIGKGSNFTIALPILDKHEK